MSPTPKSDFRGVLSESKRIINANSRHFLALSLLFILPIIFSTTLYRTLQQHLLHDSKTLTITCIYIIFVLILSPCAAGSITYSVFHGFYGRPVKLVLAINSLLRSFLPLFVTVLTSQIIQFVICFAFGLLVFLGTKGVEYSSPYFIGVCVVALVCLVLGLLYLQVNWALACVVVVVESSWGFESLRRSASLVRGMKGVALSLLLYFGYFTGIFVWSCSILTEGFDDATNSWKSWAFVVQTVTTTTLVMLLMLHSFAANTVLYMYCKAMNGELAGEIVDEFAKEYVSLPFDDGKVPHFVSVLPA